MKPFCHLLALHAYVPDTVLTNADLAAVVDTNDEWIVSRTGIRRRHRLDAADNASDMALRAARGALDDAGLLPAELTHVITATCTPDVLSPSVAALWPGNWTQGRSWPLTSVPPVPVFCTAFPSAVRCWPRITRPRFCLSAPRPSAAGSTGRTVPPACSLATRPRPAWSARVRPMCWPGWKTCSA